ncbi:MAG: prolipoprotein diacylglyceryl transferase [Phycisphaerae bacterium]|nr:prolipoprotein diacylglyceryl transferase [Phycisphaerae bacterium]
MLPTVFTIPLPGGGGIPIKGYGLMMMIGFLSAIYLCMRRAQKVRSDPDIVLNAGFLALLFGVFGARIFYVVHYWDSHFKARGLMAALDVTSGGLEWYGGFLAAVVAITIYLWIKGHSVRLFLDIMAPSVMWGLAFGRLGCTLNGCCFGGTCPSYIPWPLAVTFPYGSPAHIHHVRSNRAAVPRELMYISAFGWPTTISRENIAMKPEQIYGPQKKYKQASEALQAAFDQISPPEAAERIVKAWRRSAIERRSIPLAPVPGMTIEKLREAKRRLDEVRQEVANACAAVPNSKQLRDLINAENAAWLAWETHSNELRDLLGDSQNPRPAPGRIQELQNLAKEFRSARVFFVQPLGFINAMILAGVLSLFFYRRRVHGATFGLMFVLYPITRVILEWVRADNPIDSGGLTISQAISVGIVPMALVYMFIIYKFLPPQSPRAQIWTPPPEEPPPSANPPSGPSQEPEPADVLSASPVDLTPAEPPSQPKAKAKAKRRKSVLETVVVAPDAVEADSQEWSETEAICAKCGAALHPPEGLVYQRPGKRSRNRVPGVAEIDNPDPNTVMELICESCFDMRPPQDKSRAKRLAKKWWKTGKV